MNVISRLHYPMNLPVEKLNVISRMQHPKYLPVERLNVISHLSYPMNQPVGKLCVKMFLRRSLINSICSYEKTSVKLIINSFNSNTIFFTEQLFFFIISKYRLE